MVYGVIKRMADIAIGVVGMVLLVPIAIAVKIAYVCTGDFSSIFFVQDRIGRNGKTFKLYKFRSMVPNAEERLKELIKDDAELEEEYKRNKKLHDDPRVTKVGKFIRRYSIDELPQLINILNGTMSFVGNRPYLVSEKREMGKYYDLIVKTKAGLTGLWQVSGHTDVSFKSRMEIEAMYSEVMSPKVDFGIISKTFRAVFSNK